MENVRTLPKYNQYLANLVLRDKEYATLIIKVNPGENDWKLTFEKEEGEWERKLHGEIYTVRCKKEKLQLINDDPQVKTISIDVAVYPM